MTQKPDQRGFQDLPKVEEIYFPGLQKCVINEFPGAIDLVTLVVEEGNRGKGIGSQVLQNLQKRARLAGKWIQVTPLAHEAKRQFDLERFYRKNGFCQEWVNGQRADYWVWSGRRGGK